ncbi:hypothetical protein SLS62_010656 [Diatrype stigma]|uniref:Chromate transporter n=1 Tax=Diatrype stigma TaxID=117547 RepID=A0AAN9UH59_9PEZI
MLYSINLLRHGALGAILGFLFWSLPGAIGMFGLSLGVSHMGDTLPGPVYALLSGINASAVGITVLAAVQLSGKAITDKLTRVLLFLSASAGLLYTALWYFPVLIVMGGAVAIVYDFRWLHGAVKPVVAVFKLRRRVQVHDNVESQSSTASNRETGGDDQATSNQDLECSSITLATEGQTETPGSGQGCTTSSSEKDKLRVVRLEHRSNIS